MLEERVFSRAVFEKINSAKILCTNNQPQLTRNNIDNEPQEMPSFSGVTDGWFSISGTPILMGYHGVGGTGGQLSNNSSRFTLASQGEDYEYEGTATSRSAPVAVVMFIIFATSRTVHSDLIRFHLCHGDDGIVLLITIYSSSTWVATSLHVLSDSFALWWDLLFLAITGVH
jgi:hypothetical protein